MHVGDQLTISGRTAEVIKVRKTAPVAVVEYGDGSRELHWYGNDNGTVPTGRSRTGTGGFADTWTDTHILGPINNGPSSDELAEAWELSSIPAEPHETGASTRPVDIPEHSPSETTWSPETPRQAEKWIRVKSWYDRSGLCARCSSQGAWGHQLGFSNVKPPCHPCAVIVAEFPIPAGNGWNQLTQYTAPEHRLTDIA